MKYFAILATLMLFPVFAMGQFTVSGNITDGATGEPMIGATVIIEGTSIGTTTDMNGHFQLDASSEEQVLVFSFISYKDQAKLIGSQRIFEVILQPDAEQLEGVVVTALGIKREEKSLGYAVQSVGSEDVAGSNPTNIVSALSGKVAGAQIISSSGAVGSSTTITIRGNKSFSGNGQPLFVVDGTPIMNPISSSRSSTTYTDFGNAAMDIDSDNVESMTILKGASATAIYGSRAANGVILITTKKGAGKKGIGVEFSTSVAFDEVYILPDYQNDYGQGMSGSEYYWQLLHDDISYEEYHNDFGFKWSTTGTGRLTNADESWGTRLDQGFMAAQFDSPVDPVTGEVTPTPWISRPNNVKDFYETGFTQQHNLALTAGNEMANGRLSFGLMDQKGTSPNTDQTKVNVGLNTSVKLNKRVSFDVNATYTKLSNDNLPQQGNSMRNPLLEYNSWFGRQVDTKYLKERYDDIILYGGDQEPMAFNWMMGYPQQHPNPYWNAYKNTMSRSRNRLFGNAAINIELLKGVNLTAKVGTDYFSEDRRYIYHQYSRDWTDLYENASNGTLWEQKRNESETNADIFLNINKDLGENLSLFATFGANYRNAYDSYATTSGTNLVVADIFTTANYAGEPSVSFTKYQKVTNSVYGTANLGFKDYLYLDLTLRGDWSSTLPQENWNYWYPAVNVGLVLSDALDMKSNRISFIKLRGGYAIVGDDTSPYSLEPVYYSAGTSFNGVNLFSAQSTLPTYNLKPELTNSIEFGGDFKFFQNRLGLDLTYYNATTHNQLLNVDIPYSSGYSSWKTNAGSINNQGIELQLYATILKFSEGFSWDMMVNWSTNTSTVVDLAEGLTELQMNSFYYGNSLMAFPGEEWGQIYGTSFARDSIGQVLVNRKGNPSESTEYEVLGNVNPDWIGGIGNTFSYKGFSLYVLFDFRKGGDVYSLTKAVGQKTGILQSTAEGGMREDGIIVDGVYLEGSKVDLDGDGIREDVSGQANQTPISSFDYWGNSRSWGELSIIDGSFIKLREVNFSYSLPSSLINKIGVYGATISVFGRNLALLYTHESNDVHIDPEVSFGGTMGGMGLEAYQLAPSRTIGVKLNVKF